MSQAGDSHSSGRALLFTGFVVTGFVTTVLGPVLPWLTARWALTDAAAGALFTIQFTGSIVAGALSGLIVARIGSSRTLATGYALMATGLAGLALGEREVGTLAIGVAGVGLGFVVPTTNLLVARLTPEHAAAALGAVNFCWGIGAATWPVVVARFNPAPGVPIALLFVSTLLLLVAARMAAARFPAHALHETAGPAGQPSPWRRVTIFGLCIALYSGVESAFGGWIAEYHAPADGRCFDKHPMGDGCVRFLGWTGRGTWAGRNGIGPAIRECGPLLGAGAGRLPRSRRSLLYRGPCLGCRRSLWWR